MASETDLNTSGQPMDMGDAVNKARMIVQGAGPQGIRKDDLWTALNEIGLEPKDGRRKAPILTQAGLRKQSGEAGEIRYVHVEFLPEKAKPGKSQTNQPAKQATPEPVQASQLPTTPSAPVEDEVVQLNLRGGTVSFDALDGRMSGTFKNVSRVVVYFA